MSRWLTHPWLFEQPGALSPEQRQSWSELCRVESPVDDQLKDTQRSIVVLAHPGAGLSTSLDLLGDQQILAIAYQPHQWPGESNEFIAARDHFSQWMALIARQFRDQIEDEPELAARLDVPNHEFLVWLIRRYHSTRQANLWLRQLQDTLPAERFEEVKANLETNDLDQAYGQTTHALPGQIDECLDIARCLGRPAIYLTVDISWADWVQLDAAQRATLAAQVRQLLSTISPLQRKRFGIKVGLPVALEIGVAEVDQLARSRVTVATYRWDERQLGTIAGRLVHAASDGQVPVDRWFEPPIAERLWEDLRQIWGTPGPAAAAALARCIVEEGPVPAPGPREFGAVQRRLYERFAPIRLDGDAARRIVWRGRRPIYLDDAQFRCFEVLWRHQGVPVDSATLIDQSRSGTSANLDKIIQRLREKLEPFYGAKEPGAEKNSWLYIQRSPGQGVWLERFSGGRAYHRTIPPTV